MNGAHLRQKALILLLCGIFAHLVLVGYVKHTEGYAHAGDDSTDNIEGASALYIFVYHKQERQIYELRRKEPQKA